MSICKLALFSILFLFTSCGSHLVKDTFPNPASEKYHRMEFEVSEGEDSAKKEMGIANLLLYKGQDIGDIKFSVYGVYKGILSIKSNSCGINLTMNYDKETEFKLADLIPAPKKCSIKFLTTADKIRGREHNVVETGILKINLLEENTRPLTLEYSNTNSIRRGHFQTYTFVGQGSMQRQAGDLTRSEKFRVDARVTRGGIYAVSGCGLRTEGEFKENSFEVILKDLYKKNYLTKEDTCDFEIFVIPHSEINPRLARFSINIYGEGIVKLEPLNFEIKRKWPFSKKVYVSGRNYIIFCSINEKSWIKKKCKMKYIEDKTYWIRGVTSNARKSVFAIKNGKIVWKE